MKKPRIYTVGAVDGIATAIPYDNPDCSESEEISCECNGSNPDPLFVLWDDVKHLFDKGGA